MPVVYLVIDCFYKISELSCKFTGLDSIFLDISLRKESTSGFLYKDVIHPYIYAVIVGIDK